MNQLPSMELLTPRQTQICLAMVLLAVLLILIGAGAAVAGLIHFIRWLI